MKLTKKQWGKIVEAAAEEIIARIENEAGDSYSNQAWERVNDGLCGDLWDVVTNLPLPAELRTTQPKGADNA